MRRPRWIKQKSRRARRSERIEATWYREYGCITPCSICALDHPAMVQIDSEDEEKIFQYCCPIARRDIWPPAEEEDSDNTVWDSLEPSPEKFAKYYYFNIEEIQQKLKIWETSIYSLLIPMAEVEEFKDRVLRFADTVRSSWKYKRTIIVSGHTRENLTDSELDAEDGYVDSL